MLLLYTMTKIMSSEIYYFVQFIHKYYIVIIYIIYLRFTAKIDCKSAHTDTINIGIFV